MIHKTKDIFMQGYVTENSDHFSVIVFDSLLAEVWQFFACVCICAASGEVNTNTGSEYQYQR